MWVQVRKRQLLPFYTIMQFYKVKCFQIILNSYAVLTNNKEISYTLYLVSLIVTSYKTAVRSPPLH